MSTSQYGGELITWKADDSFKKEKKWKFLVWGSVQIKLASQESGLQAVAEILPKPEHKLAQSISPQLDENERKTTACTAHNPGQTRGSSNVRTQQKYLATLDEGKPLDNTLSR